MTQVRSMTQLPNTELRSYHSFTKGLYGLEIDCTEYNIGGGGPSWESEVALKS